MSYRPGRLAGFDPPGLPLKRLSDLAGGQPPPATDFGYSKALADQPRRR